MRNGPARELPARWVDASSLLVEGPVENIVARPRLLAWSRQPSKNFHDLSAERRERVAVENVWGMAA